MGDIAMAELGIGATPRELIPGDPEAVDALASRLGGFAASSGTGAARLRSLDSDEWRGEAGDAFRAVIGELPEKLDRGVNAFDDAAAALRSFADTLREAQRTAARAIREFERGEGRSTRWAGQVDSYTAGVERARATGAPPPDGPPPSETDPGGAERDAAMRLLSNARSAVEEAAGRAAARLEAGGKEAPDEPGVLSKAWGQTKEFFKGAAEATYGMLEFVYKLTVVYELVDPDGYAENLEGLRQGLVYGVENPEEFAKAFLDWETWKDNPARALGRLVPDLLLTAATAGGGAAARGTRGVKALDRLDAPSRPSPKGSAGKGSANGPGKGPGKDTTKGDRKEGSGPTDDGREKIADDTVEGTSKAAEDLDLSVLSDLLPDGLGAIAGLVARKDWRILAAAQMRVLVRNDVPALLAAIEIRRGPRVTPAGPRRDIPALIAPDRRRGAGGR